jgi:hypothetical protein
MAWTTSDDVLNRWVGDDKPTDTDLIDVLIEDAEAIILSNYPSIQDRIDSNSLPVNIVKLVVSRMVTRTLRNPENLTYLQQGVGSFSQAKNYGSTAPTTLTNEDKELLNPNTQKGKAFSVNMAPNIGKSLDPWLSWDLS